MLIICLLGFSVILQNGAQELSGLKHLVHADEPVANYDAKWNKDGQYEPSIVHALAKEASKVPRNENQDSPLTYSNYWGQISTAPRSVYDENVNPHAEDIKVFYFNLSNSTSIEHGVSDSNDSRPFIYPLNLSTDKHEKLPSSEASGSRQLPLPFFGSASDTRPALQSFPVFYSPPMSINMRRRFANGASEHPSPPKSNASISEPISSSYEETYSRVVPPVPFPGMQFTPNTLLPYSRFSYPMQFHPFPALPKPHSTRFSNGNEFPEDNANSYVQQFDRELGVDNPSALNDRNLNHSATPMKSTHVRSSKVSQSVPNAFILPTLAPETLRSFRPFLQTPVFPIPPVNREQFPNGQPIPLDAVLEPSSVVDPNQFIPQNALSPPFERYPFLLPLPALPTVIPRVIPQYPALVPDIRTTEPQDVPAVSNTLEDRLDSSVVSPILSETVVEDDTLAEGTPPPETPDDISPYEFGFDMNDGKGTDQHRMEVSDGAGVVRGSYGYKDQFGVYRRVNYVADKNGFRAYVKSNEPGLASPGSADVVVEAEHPPPHAVEEAVKASEPEITVLPNADLIVE